MPIILTDSDSGIPGWFRRSLHDIDPALVVYHNPFRNKFVIDRCTRDDASLHDNHLRCPKVNVTEFQHIGTKALDDLKASDLWQKHGSIENFRRANTNMEADWKEKNQREQREVYENVARDDKRQIQKIVNEMDSSDMSNYTR